MFKTKILNLIRFIHFDWLAKIELTGPGPPHHPIVVSYCFTRVLLYAKMLRETETEETIGFFVAFLSLVAFQLEVERGPWAPLATHRGEGELLLKNGTIDRCA